VLSRGVRARLPGDAAASRRRFQQQQRRLFGRRKIRCASSERPILTTARPAIASEDLEASSCAFSAICGKQPAAFRVAALMAQEDRYAA
jgi:hypothetical protein